MNQYKLEKLLNSLNLKVVGRKYLRLAISILVMVHILGCVWHYVPQLDSDANLRDSWVHRYDYQDESHLDRYIGSIYFILTILFTIGYGNIVPYTLLEKCVVIVFMFVGVLFFGYTLAYLTNLQFQINLKKNQQTQRTDFFKQAYFKFGFGRPLLKKILMSSV